MLSDVSRLRTNPMRQKLRPAGLIYPQIGPDESAEDHCSPWRIAHETILRHFHLRLNDFPFRHNYVQRLPNGLSLLSSYHCSRYNVQTNRLTLAMFDEVLTHLRSLITSSQQALFLARPVTIPFSLTFIFFLSALCQPDLKFRQPAVIEI